MREREPPSRNAPAGHGVRATRRSRLLGWLVASAVGATALALAPAAGATAVGINVAATSGDFFNAPGVISAIQSSRPAWVRLFVGWNAIEPAQGTFNTAEIQNYQHFLAELPAGTSVDVDVEGTPPWAAGGSTDSRTPPTDNASFGGFLNYLVNALGTRVDAWEIWNEEDSTAWWTGTPAQYAGLLRTAYVAIKSADSNATVLLGGLTGNDVVYLNELYAAGARGSFDAVAVHTDTACNVTSPYVFEFDRGTQTINQYFFLGFTAIHAAMVTAGDGAKPIYMTELGWSSTTAECETGAWAGQKLAGVDQPTQATYLQQAYHCLAQPQYAYVKAAMWFELLDNGSSTTPLDNYGLLSNDYTAKPAFTAFEQESLDGDQLTGPCASTGVTSPAVAQPKDRPVIRVLRPTAGAHYSGAVKIAVTAIAPAAGVREITIDLTRTKRVHFMARGFPTTFSRSFAWRRAKLLKPGRYRIKVIVVGKLGTVASTTFSIVRATVRHRRAIRPRRRGGAVNAPACSPLVAERIESRPGDQGRVRARRAARRPSHEAPRLLARNCKASRMSVAGLEAGAAD